LAKTLRRWRDQILAHRHTGASSGRVEAANLTIKQVKPSGRGLRTLARYRPRILLAGESAVRDTRKVTSIRSRRPRFLA
jgi:transposase